MRPTDIRQTYPHSVGECYCCRRIYSLDDMTPVRSASAADWRYICPLCRDVAKYTRPPAQQRAIMAQRMRDEAQREST